MAKATGTNTVSSELLNKFYKEIESYAKLVQKALSGETLFGSQVQMPARNLNDITASFINTSTDELAKTGLKRTRAKSISKYVFEKALETKMAAMGM